MQGMSNLGYYYLINDYLLFNLVAIYLSCSFVYYIINFRRAIKLKNIIFIVYHFYIIFNIANVLFNYSHKVNMVSNILLNNGQKTILDIINKHLSLSNLENIYEDYSKTLIKPRQYHVSYEKMVLHHYYNTTLISSLIPAKITNDRLSIIMNDLLIHFNNIHNEIYYIELPKLYEKLLVDINRELNPFEGEIFMNIRMSIKTYSHIWDKYFEKYHEIAITTTTLVMTISYLYYLIF